MKIAITGGAGFIGARLAAALAAQGHEIAVIDTAAPDPVDVTNRRDLARAIAGCTMIYHLAAAHRDDVRPRRLYYDINRGGTENLIAAAKEHDISHIVFLSSVAVYGNAHEDEEPDERTVPAPAGDYAQSKWEAEYQLQEWALESPERVCTIIRPAVVFGEGNRGNVHMLMDRIAARQFVMVGNGRNKKSMAYVGNLVAFLVYCLNVQANWSLYNYADKPDMTMNGLVGLIASALGHTRAPLRLSYGTGMLGAWLLDIKAFLTGRAPVNRLRVKKFCRETVYAADQYRATGFVPPYGLEEGLRRMIAAEFPFAIEPRDEGGSP